MQKKVLSALLGILTLILFTAAFLYGGTTGKVAGRITDAETGEGLPGANVQLEGTTLGAATDLNGNYTILNVPPGVYTVNISFIGYQNVRVSEVRVNVDLTTRVDQALKPSAVEMAAVEVVGERNPLIREDLTNTLVAVTAEQIDALPIEQIRDVITLQAGIVEDNEGDLHIRGGRSNEIAYEVNGISINNPFSNTQAVGLATNAVQEVSVSAGTFSAEYGNALSGVINFVTKDGGPDYNGTLKVWTGDHFSSRDNVFFNINEQDLSNNARLEWTFSGPVPLFGDKLTFFTSGVFQDDDGHLYGMRVYNRDEILFIAGEDFIIDPLGASGRAGQADGDREIVPMVTRRDLNLTGKLTWKPSKKIKLTYDLILDDGERFPRVANGVNIFRRFRFNPDGRPKRFTNNTSYSIGLTHAVSSNTFYTLKLGVNFTDSRTFVFEDPFDPRYVRSFENEITNNLIPPTDYLAGGTDLNRNREETRSLLAKVDVVSQVLPSHEVKFGGEFRHHRLDLLDFELLFDPEQGRFIIPRPEINPGFTNFQEYRREPIQASLYVLDKMELSKQFILNVGLRYEFLDARALYNPDLAGTVDTGVDENLVGASPKHRFAPRISLSFPITDQGIIRFSYGIFYQNPTFRQIFRNPRFEDFDFRTTPTFGNPNLDPEQSIQYEIGLQQQFTDDFKADLTLFYKDVNNLIQTRRVIAGEVAIDKEFNVVTNISSANVKGLTLSLLKRRAPGGLLSATLDYTFQVGEGTFTDPLDLAVDTRTGRETEQAFIPLDFDRTHTLNSTLMLSKGRNWAISAIGIVQTGTPYSPSLPSSVQAVEFEENSSRRPILTNLDLKLEKFFAVQGVRFSVFMQIDNVLDTRNERRVHFDTGRSLVSLDETTNPNLFDNLREEIRENPGNFFPEQFLDNFYQREDFLGAPREVRGGMTFQF
ncbi:TonB-dependent receptor [candidate division KSB1 bacterium]|nr:TonB-dependent receptor [candidate division KSB1 bacterium]